MNESDVRYVYSVSDKDLLIPKVIHSITTLERFVDKEAITVFYTPPRSNSNHMRLSKIAEVREVENITKSFVFLKERGSGRYGEKLHLCDVDSPTVVFLDADTIVKKDLCPLFEGEFDFSARMHYPPNADASDFDTTVWREMFRSINKKEVAMPNTGFMIFKDHCHQKIREEWLKYINDDNLPNACLHSNPKEQTALALALSSFRIQWMTEKEHAFRWLGEQKADTCVVHGTPDHLIWLWRLREGARTR